MSDMRYAIEDIREENKKLKAENEKLQAALKVAVDALRGVTKAKYHAADCAHCDTWNPEDCDCFHGNFESALAEIKEALGE